MPAVLSVPGSPSGPGMQEQDELESSAFMNRALEVSVRIDKYPKSSIDVYALVLQDDGGALSAAITCASLALAHAGIEMHDLVAACHAVRHTRPRPAAITS